MEDADRDKTLSTGGVNHLPLPRGRFKVSMIAALLADFSFTTFPKEKHQGAADPYG